MKDIIIGSILGSIMFVIFTIVRPYILRKKKLNEEYKLRRKYNEFTPKSNKKEDKAEERFNK